ncbi:hypothetical protein [Paenibacillus sp. GCM10027626]|uniref:hypothetical protein n=1 Tax=Paenibacillus sp. GCM10027626 TaxID=3273411 RepID=UPI00363F7E3B
MLKSQLVVGILLAAIGIAVLDQLAKPVVEEMRTHVISYAERELRVPPYDAVVYTPLWIEHLRGELDGRKPVIGFFGSSTVYGSTVKKSQNTAAGVFQNGLQDYRVVNLGLSGARFTDTYTILQSIIEQVDIVIFEINYGMTVVSDNEPEAIAYPTLAGKLGYPIKREWLAPFPDKNEHSLPGGLHSWIASGLDRVTLYRERDVLSYYLFKTRTPKEKIRRELAKQSGKTTPADPMYKAYDSMTKESKQRIDQGFRKLYTWNKPFSEEDSFGLFMIGKTLDLLQRHNKKAFFYTAPLDYSLIQNRNLLQWDDYERVMGVYCSLVESRGYPFLEFNRRTPVIPHHLYRDPTHLTDAGSRQFGEILFRQIVPQLKEAGDVSA